jgi:DNA-binding IclR family transcriptional regulator
MAGKVVRKLTGKVRKKTVSLSRLPSATKRRDRSEARQAAILKNHKRYIIPGLRRGLELLQHFNRDHRIMTQSNIANAMKVSRSTAFRLLYTLEDMGFVERDKDGKTYRLGSKVLTLGFEYLASLDVVDVARPFLELLRDDTGASSHLAIRDGREIIYLSRVPTRHPLTSTAVLGGRRPAHATPMGRILLCELPEKEVRQLYRGVTLRAFTEQTPTTLEALIELLRKDCTRGVVVSRGSFELGRSSIAAPVRSASGEIIAAIEIAGPNSAFNLDELDTRLKDKVCATALEISNRLGYQPGKTGN